MYDQVNLVDEQDQEIGQCDKLLAHQKGYCHRAFSIFVGSDCPQAHILLHKRHHQKYHSGRLWTNACCSHPQPDKTITTCLTERLQYEMGIESTSFEKIGECLYKHTFNNGLTEHEYDHVYLCYIAKDTKIRPNPEEVESTFWLPHQEVDAWSHQFPQEFSPWFPYLWPNILKKIQTTEKT